MLSSSSSSGGGDALTYEQWVKQATSSESIPPNSDGLLHVGERAALVEQLSYLKKRNTQLMKQQRAVLLAACEAQAAHAQCADFAGELMRAKMNGEEGRRPEDEGNGGGGKEDDDVADKLQRLEHENAELMRKTAVLVDYVRATAPLPRAAYGPRDDEDDDDDEDDEDDYDDDDDKELPPKANIGIRVSGACLPPPVGFDEFASRHWRQCKWEDFVSGVMGAFGAANAGAVEDE